MSPAALVLDFALGSFAAAVQQWLPQTTSETPVVVAVPGWFGMADRHQLVTYLDPDGDRSVGLVSSCLAGFYGHYGRSPLRSSAAVLCLDVRGGWSAGLVHFEPDGPTEVAAWGVAPQDLAGRLDDAVTCPWLVDHLFTAASAVAGTESIRAVLVIDDAGSRAALVRQAVRECRHQLARCPVLVGESKRLVAAGAALLSRSDSAPPSTGALAHALTVRADGDPERLAMHVVAAEHAPFPSTNRQMFALGPDDGAPLHFDIYEQHHSAPGENNVEHRLVVRANLVRERGFDRNMMVTFELGANGLLTVGPVNAWQLDWQPGSLDLDGER